MKDIRRLIKGLIACSLAVTLVSTAAAQTIQGTAKVTKIKGDARFTKGNNVWQPLKVGMVVTAGTLIQTAKDSYVDFVAGASEGPPAGGASGSGHTSAASPGSEQNTCRVKSDSAVAIDKFTITHTGADIVTELQLDLQRGKLLASVKKMSAASKYEVKIPNGVAGIRGTIIEVWAEGVVRVVEGSLVLAYVGPDGTVQTQVVVQGQQFDARTGQITPIPPPQQDALTAEAHSTQPITYTVATSLVLDKTIHYASPTAPPFTPPGPPPNTPPVNPPGPPR